MFGMTEDQRKTLLADSIPSFQATSEESLNLGFGEIFYGVARAMRPKRVLVIGSKAGFAPACFGQAVKDNEGSGIDRVLFDRTELSSSSPGHVHFVDPSYSIRRNDPNHSFGIGTWDRPNEVTARWERYGLQDYVTHHKVTSQQFLHDTAASDLDIVYIDGDHSYDGIKHDIVQYAERLALRGVILAHDVDPLCDESDGFAVLRDLDPAVFEVFRLPVFPGLAFIRPRRDQ